MLITDKFFGWYKTTNALVKVLLFAIFLVFCVFWIIGSLARLDRAAMFLVGLIAGAVMIYLWYPQVNEWVMQTYDWIIQLIP